MVLFLRRCNIIAIVLICTSCLCLSQYYLWDLNNDPTESVNLYSDNSYTETREYIASRFSYWKDTLVAGDNRDSASKTAEAEWKACGNTVCTYIENNFTLQIEQIYHPANPPHIIFVMVDDWGWNDIGYRSTYMNWTTPTIDKLATQGVKLENYFTHNFCVPSRGAFLTGRFAGRLGLLADIDGMELPLSEVTIAQELKSAGYRTHMVGKWHVGDSSKARTPTYRGFDTFYGYYNGFMDPWTKYYLDYLDLHDGTELVDDEEELSEDLHSAMLFQTKVEDILEDHAANYASDPLFLFYSMQMMHWPYLTPIHYELKCSGFVKTPPDNAIYCSMNILLDEAIANLTCALEKTGLLSNTVIIVASDNGGEESIPGNSLPFRGHKYDMNRGALSATAFIVSQLIPTSAQGTSYEGQMHVTDWLPTIMGLATEGAWNGSYTGAVVDGVDMWDTIMTGADTLHNEIVHYLSTDGEGSIQYDMVKLDINQTLADYDPVAKYFTADFAPWWGGYSCSNPDALTDSSSSSSSTDTDEPGGHHFVDGDEPPDEHFVDTRNADVTTDAPTSESARKHKTKRAPTSAPVKSARGSSGGTEESSEETAQIVTNITTAVAGESVMMTESWGDSFFRFTEGSLYAWAVSICAVAVLASIVIVKTATAYHRRGILPPVEVSTVDVTESLSSYSSDPPIQACITRVLSSGGRDGWTS